MSIPRTHRPNAYASTTERTRRTAATTGDGELARRAGVKAQTVRYYAELRLGRTFSRPDYGLGVKYSHEEGDQIVLGGMTVTLPVFSKGQELRAVGAARAARLRAELDAARSRVQIEVRSAFDVYTRRLAAVRYAEVGVPVAARVTRVLVNAGDSVSRGQTLAELTSPELGKARADYLSAEARVTLADAALERKRGLASSSCSIIASRRRGGRRRRWSGVRFFGLRSR